MSGAREQLERQVRAFLDAIEVAWEPGAREGETVVTLPGEHKLRTVCSLVAGEQWLSVSAFVIRAPDENHRAFYAHLLRRNLRLPGLAYAIDRLGDVYVTGRVPSAGVDDVYVDRLLGVVLEACDAAFDELLRLGFLASMRREWAWRVSRGESTANLEAFRPLLESSGEQSPDVGGRHDDGPAVGGRHDDGPEEEGSPAPDDPAQSRR